MKMRWKQSLFLCLVFFLSVVSSQIEELNMSSSGGGYATGDNTSVSSGGGIGYTGEDLNDEISDNLARAVERQIQGVATEEDLALIEEYQVNVQVTEINGERKKSSNFWLIWSIISSIIIFILAYLLIKNKESKTISVS